MTSVPLTPRAILVLVLFAFVVTTIGAIVLLLLLRLFRVKDVGYGKCFLATFVVGLAAGLIRLYMQDWLDSTSQWNWALEIKIAAVACFAALVIALLFVQRMGLTPVFAVGVWAVLFYGLPVFLLGSVHQAHESVARADVKNSLRQIQLSMQFYADKHGSLPAAATLDDNGKPLLSWRVEILPFLEGGKYQTLYDEFHHDEPWDSPHNLSLLPRMPDIYRIRSTRIAMPHHTPFMVFATNPEQTSLDLETRRFRAPFSSRRGPSNREFTDGTNVTILVVESTKLVPWTCPEDLTYDPSRRLPPLLDKHADDCLAVLANGDLISLTPDTSEDAIRSAITIQGGEKHALRGSGDGD